ncbi:MAG TPA: alpha/beta fold hydrolase [Candidatus Limnocylindria bacterium]|nr:alpha/beta fold hydrolase [Candidatus Limnocylindria bacterium]
MRTSTIEVLGSRIRVIEAGSGEPAVLFVHGVGGWAENWAETIATVAATGRRAVAFDLPGFGDSSAVSGARYFDADRPFYALVVEGVRQVLGLERPHLVGHSLGGGIAFITAVTYPNAYRSLTLVAPGGLGAEIALFLRALSIPVLALTARLPRPKRWGKAVLRSCFHDPSRVPAHLYAEGERYDRTYPETLRVMRHVATLRGVRPALRRDWIGRAGAYGGPVLVIWGRDDAIVPAAHAAAIRGLFPDVEVRVIDDAGHLVMSERPDAFAAALLPFLDEPVARTMADGVRHQER